MILFLMHIIVHMIVITVFVYIIYNTSKKVCRIIITFFVALVHSLESYGDKRNKYQKTIA